MLDKYRDRIKVDYAAGAAMYGGADVAGAAFATVDFPGTLAEGDHAAVSAMLMRVMAVGLFCLMATQTCTGILQGLGLQNIPVRNLAAGLLAKIVVSLVLLKIPSLNVVGAAHRHGGVLCGLCADGSISYFA